MEKMIRIPCCFFCVHFNADTRGCPAHPKGLDGFWKLYSEDANDCGGGVSFQEKPGHKYNTKAGYAKEESPHAPAGKNEHLE